MKKVIAKFNLTSWMEPDGSMNVSGYPVYSDDPNNENKAFSDSTPSGQFQMKIAKDKEAQKFFEGAQGKAFYLEISEAPTASAPAESSEATEEKK